MSTFTSTQGKLEAEGALKTYATSFARIYQTRSSQSMLEPILALIDPKAPRNVRRRGLVLLYLVAAILQLPIPSLVAPLTTNSKTGGIGVVLVFVGIWLGALVIIEWLARRALSNKKTSALAQVALLDGGLFGVALVLGILLMRLGAGGWAWGLIMLGLLWLLRGFFRLAPLV